MGMNDINVTVGVILAALGAITVVAKGIEAIRSLSPTNRLNKKLEEHGKKLTQDYQRLNSMEEIIGDLKEGNREICFGVKALLHHEITGNSIDKLKDAESQIDTYLINRGG